MDGVPTSSVIRLRQDLLRGLNCDFQVPRELAGVDVFEVVEGVVPGRSECMVEEAWEGEGGEGDHRGEQERKGEGGRRKKGSL